MRQGGLRDAILHSAGANADHGVRRTIPDRRRAVLMLVQDEEWASWSDREIARRCAVGPDMVGRLRPDTVGERQYVHPRSGNVTQMDTARIGRRTAEPAPDPPAPESAPAPDAPEPQPSNLRPSASLPR